MPRPPVSLRFFGGIAVEREGKPLGGRATQRRRLGVLAVLAAAPAGQVGRDKLLGYLWPEAETEGGRHLLAGAVYELRKALGEDAILSRGDELALNPEVVASDLTGFDEALAEGRRDEAISLYRGPFADGFFISRAPEFERWLDAARNGYREAYRQALQESADDHEQADDMLGASQRWVRLAASDPADAAVVLHAMRALDGAGQTAAALRQGEFHASHVRREFGVEPDPRVVALAGDIVRRQRNRATGPDAPPGEVPGPVVVDRSTGIMPRPVVRAALWMLSAAAALLLLAISRFSGSPTVASPDAPAEVVDVEVRTPRAQDNVPAPRNTELAALLAEALHRGGGIRATLSSGTMRRGLSITVPVLLGGTRGRNPAYLETAFEERSGELRLRASLFRGGAPVAAAEATGAPSQATEVVDRLALGLLAAWPRAPAERLTGAAARNTRSLAALTSWRAGEQHFRSGRFLAASDAFARAVAADTAFALGYYRLSQARLAADFPETEVSDADRRLLESSPGLEERDRLLINAYAGFRAGHAEYAEQRYQGLTTRYPDDLEAWLQLGETRFHYGPLRGVPLSAAWEPFRRAAALDPGNWSAIWHLAHLDASGGRHTELARALDQLLGMTPERSQELELRTLRAEDPGAVIEAAAQLRDADELLLFQIAWREAVFLQDLTAAERTARILADPARPTNSQMLGRVSLGHLALARGQYQAALGEQKRLAALKGVEAAALAFRVAAVLLPDAPDSPAELQAIRETVTLTMRSAETRQRPYYTLLLGLLDAAVGHDQSALARADELDRSGGERNALLIRAEVAYRRGELERAVMLLDQRGTVGWYGQLVGSPASFEGRARFLHAEALFRLGRLQEALRWYGSLGEHALADLDYLGPSLLRRGQIFESLKQPGLAAREHRRLAALWQTADPTLRAVADSLSRAHPSGS